jgi:cation transport regulator ChaC
VTTDPTVWYFAYGSNLDPGTFLGRRRMRPLRAEVSRLDDWALCFDLPVGPGERGVGNVRPRPGERVWGVAYELEASQASRLDLSEGVHRGAYQRACVRLETSRGESLAAFTYHSSRGLPGRKPSRRYLGLLLAGARHHGLPADWMAALRALPLAVDERDAQLELPLSVRPARP